MDLNKVQLIWRATSNLEVKTIESSNTSVVNFTIVTNRKFRKDEALVEEAEFHRCVAYGKGAEILGQYVTKWKRIYVEGRLRTKKWQDTEGSTRYSTEIIVDNFIFLDSKSSNAAENLDVDNSVIEDEEVPF